LQPRQRPAQEAEYRELVDRYHDRSEFRELVKEFVVGLGLEVLDAGDHGIVLSPAAESAFALRPAEFRPGSSTTDDRLLDGLVQLTIAATIYPTSRDLEDEPTRARPPVTIDEIDENLRRLCRGLEQQSLHAPDPAANGEEAGLYEAWRVFQSRLSAIETSDRRQSPRATRRIIQYSLDSLCEHGCFLRESRSGRVYYQPTWRYQVQLRQAAALYVFQRVRAAVAEQDQAGESR